MRESEKGPKVAEVLEGFFGEEGEGCNGLCLFASDIGGGTISQLVYAHPDCSEHQGFYKGPKS
jgi:hypothetical protein